MRILILTLLAFWALPSLAERLTGRVVGVHDGDTITVLLGDNSSVKVRLAQIDAPELKQSYGKDSKKTLSDLVFDREVVIDVVGPDRYGRTVGNVLQGDVDLNREMVREGAAWAYRKYLTDASLLDVEDEARIQQRGLWSLQEDQRDPPWEWRRARRIGKP